ncbi:hypothetical protein Agub_g9897, partial [Astrephomene gubernaculifera]
QGTSPGEEGGADGGLDGPLGAACQAGGGASGGGAYGAGEPRLVPTSPGGDCSVSNSFDSESLGSDDEEGCAVTCWTNARLATAAAPGVGEGPVGGAGATHCMGASGGSLHEEADAAHAAHQDGCQSLGTQSHMCDAGRAGCMHGAPEEPLEDRRCSQAASTGLHPAGARRSSDNTAPNTAKAASGGGAGCHRPPAPTHKPLPASLRPRRHVPGAWPPPPPPPPPTARRGPLGPSSSSAAAAASAAKRSPSAVGRPTGTAAAEGGAVPHATSCSSGGGSDVSHTTTTLHRTASSAGSPALAPQPSYHLHPPPSTEPSASAPTNPHRNGATAAATRNTTTAAAPPMLAANAVAVGPPAGPGPLSFSAVDLERLRAAEVRRRQAADEAARRLAAELARELEQLAGVHRRRALLKWCGLHPWQQLLEAARRDLQQAAQHHRG